MAIKFLIVSLGLWLIYSGIADKSPLSVFTGATNPPNTTGSGGNFVPNTPGTDSGGGGGFGARSTNTATDTGMA